jgi:hypothetical protein
MVTFPSVEAMMIVLPVEEGPNSFERSTLIVNTDPSMLISMFFMIVSFQHANGDSLSLFRGECEGSWFRPLVGFSAPLRK